MSTAWESRETCRVDYRITSRGTERRGEFEIQSRSQVERGKRRGEGMREVREEITRRGIWMARPKRREKMGKIREKERRKAVIT